MKLLLLLILCVCNIQSQTAYLKVWLHDGTSTMIPIQEIQKITFSGISDVNNNRLPSLISTFILFQNYPNPFNPTTTIQYNLPSAGQVQVKIFNITGQLIRTMKKDYGSQGTYSIVWDGRTDKSQPVSSGIYFYQVTFENSTLIRKMLLIK